MATAPDRVLAGYRILRELGRGGMGLVYEAEHVSLGRRAALKILEPRLASDEQFRERFVQESRLVAAIDHPNIIPIYDAGETDGTLYLAMRLVDGDDVEGLVARDGPLAPEHALLVLEQAGAALDAAHARDLVHRDVKPANILIDRPTERAFLTDFGIAKHARSSGMTSAGLFVGTVDYAAPEQIEGKPAAPPADVYSFGCVLYFCLTGAPPFRKDTDVAVVYAHLLEPPPKPTDARPELPAAFDDVVAIALAKSPDDRYATCAEVVAAARAAIAGVAARRAPTRGMTVGAAPAAFPPSNLPVAPTALIGRDDELARLREALGGDSTQLVTVTGPGGSGKTHLALEAAASVAERFDDGVFFVDLTAIHDAARVPVAIAEVLSVEDAPREADGTDETAHRLRRRLRDASVLLVLDNFEHVLPAASFIGELVAGAPRCLCLVTSQAALRIHGERELQLAPLALPPTGTRDRATLLESPTVALFLQRARAVRQDLHAADDDMLAGIAEICRRLDGLPLAIELAAARTKVLTPAAMLDRLDDRLTFLASGARDVPSRHRTLRSTIEWSHDLLEAHEQAVFARLSVFDGGCTLEAAEEIVDPTALDTLESLLDKSLLRERTGAGAELRFEMLQSIHEYARFRLIERGELDLVRERHALYYFAQAEAAEAELFGAAQAEWLARLEDEAPNIRAALAWSLETGKAEDVVRGAAALSRFWSIRGQMSEARRWLDASLERDARLDGSVRAKGLYAAGYAALGQGDYAEAIARFEESLELFRADDDASGAGMALAQLGWLRAVRGELKEASALSEEGLRVGRELGDDRIASVALSNLAEVAARRGDHERAVELFAEALGLRRALGDPRNIANALLNLGRAELLRSDSGRAIALLHEGLSLAADLADTWGMSLAQIALGRAALAAGDRDRATGLLADAMKLCREREDKYVAAECLTALGAVAADDDPALAARLWGAAEGLREQMAVDPSPAERSLYAVHLPSLSERLGADAFGAERAAGRALALDDAILQALRGVGSAS